MPLLVPKKDPQWATAAARVHGAGVVADAVGVLVVDVLAGTAVEGVAAGDLVPPEQPAMSATTEATAQTAVARKNDLLCATRSIPSISGQ